MMAQERSFLGALTRLWLRLSTVAIICLLFLLALQVPGAVRGMFFYLDSPAVVFGIAATAVAVAVSGAVLGAVCTAAIAPLLFYRPSSRQRIAESATGAAVAIAAFLDFGATLNLILQSAHVWGREKAVIWAGYLIVFALILYLPRRRKQLVTSLDDYLGEKATRRAVLGTGACAAALAVAEAAMGKTSPAVTPRRSSPPAGPNILLVTFDALSAEDMSLYGYRLPTTPHIDEFARKSSVFTGFYSGSTFTTPSVATMLTGLAPSEHRVYHLQGSLRGSPAVETLPRAMRAGGYYTGASIGNPYAYFLAQGIAADYDALPEPAYRTEGFLRLWDGLGALHQRRPRGVQVGEFENLEALCNLFPLFLEEGSPRIFGRTRSGYPPAGSFEQGRRMLERMPDGFFLWVHLFAPHWPYLPDARYLGRFLPSNTMRTATEQLHVWTEDVYPPEMQRLIDKARLRYDEFISDADSAFGAFLDEVGSAGRLRNTAVIVSADHGESFEGRIYTHGLRYQTRPELHIPLIVHMPGQETGSRVAFTADQTMLAPTILDIAGLPRPGWMRGESLRPWLNRDGEGEGQGLAFTQYLATNSIFKPITHGTVGVIDGRHQYVLNLDSGKGILRGLAEAQSWNLDRSAENPALAQTLREAIYARFPELPRKPA